MKNWLKGGLIGGGIALISYVLAILNVYINAGELPHLPFIGNLNLGLLSDILTKFPQPVFKFIFDIFNFFYIIRVVIHIKFTMV